MRGILLDSGDTVIGPRGGRWNPRYDFEELLVGRWPELSAVAVTEAVEAGDRFMESYPGTPPYAQYYRAILEHLDLDVTWSDEELLAALLPPRSPEEVVEIFPDARGALVALQGRGVPIVVVSNAWAGLDGMYEGLGIAGYFKGFVISEVLGCDKPDERMFRAGSELLGMEPNECLFVDDHAPHVHAAIKLGYHGRVISRRGPSGGTDSIRSLMELVDLF